MSRRVLMVAYFFPPLGGAGVQRTVKHVKYLPAHGWDPIVVTTNSRAYPARDPSLGADIAPGTVVVRAREPRLWRAWAWAAARVPVRSVSQMLTWPDGAAGWLPAAVGAGLRAVRRHRPDAIYSTSAPETAHLVALVIARRTGLPWVADFRDEWLHNPWRQDRPAHLRTLTERAEAAVVRRADRIVFAAEYFRVADAAAHVKATTITNGVDPDDVPSDLPGPPVDRFRIAFVGTLYEDLDAAPVTAALGRLAARGAIDPSACRLRVVGNVWLPGRLGAGDVPVEQTGYVFHREAVAEMAQASVLLLYVPETSRATTQKVFEYLATGRPVLCITRWDTLAWEVVSELDAGVCAEPGDAAGIEAAIAGLYERWRAGGLPQRPDVRAAALERFSRRRLAGDLARVLDEARAGRG